MGNHSHPVIWVVKSHTHSLDQRIHLFRNRTTLTVRKYRGHPSARIEEPTHVYSPVLDLSSRYEGAEEKRSEEEVTRVHCVF